MEEVLINLKINNLYMGVNKVKFNKDLNKLKQ